MAEVTVGLNYNSTFHKVHIVKYITNVFIIIFTANTNKIKYTNQGDLRACTLMKYFFLSLYLNCDSFLGSMEKKRLNKMHIRSSTCQVMYCKSYFLAKKANNAETSCEESLYICYHLGIFKMVDIPVCF